MGKRTRKTAETPDAVRKGHLNSNGSIGMNIVQRVMREMGAKGGRIGGKRRLETMTDEQRRRSARKAARARWSKTKNHQ